MLEGVVTQVEACMCACVCDICRTELIYEQLAAGKEELSEGEKKAFPPANSWVVVLFAANYRTHVRGDN